MEPKNPYATDAESLTPNAPVMHVSSGMVNHVMVVGILQIVLGFLELAMSGFWLLTGLAGPMAQMAEGPGEIDPAANTVLFVMFGVFIAGGVAIGLFALMRIASGIASFYFRGRIWTVISLIGGLASVFTCYCSPFSIGLCIYGLIVMFNPQVGAAYAMSRQGLRPEEIKRQLTHPQM